jgi:hypothetical protein
MNISSKISLREFFALNSKNISDLPNTSNLEKIYTYVNGSPVSWINGDPDFLQGFLSLSRLTGYLVVSKDSVSSYPYVFYSENDVYPYIKYITGLFEISTFLAPTVNLSDAAGLGANINKIYRIVNNSPVSWINGDPEFLQGFSSIENGQTYLIISKSNVIPYTYYELPSLGSLENTLFGISNMEELHNSVESILYSEF